MQRLLLSDIVSRARGGDHACISLWILAEPGSRSSTKLHGREQQNKSKTCIYSITSMSKDVSCSCLYFVLFFWVTCGEDVKAVAWFPAR